ncbi:MAG TPA: endospore germination permease [Bacilli bacterium]
MDSHQKLNHRQMAWIVGTILIGGGIISLPHSLYGVARSDAWFSQLLPAAYSFFVAAVFVFLARRFPGKNIFAIFNDLFGNRIGGVANGLILFYIWLILARDLTGLYQIIRSTLLPNTPVEMILLIFIAILMQYGNSSIEVPARVVDLIFPLFISLLILLPFFLLNEMDFTLLEPVLTISPRSLANANFITAGWYADVFVVGAFLHTLNVPKKLSASLRHGIALSGLFLTFLAAMNIAILGSGIAAKTIYPNFALIQQIHITDFLDRLDIFVFSIWIPIYTLKIICFYLAFLHGLAGFTPKKDYQPLNKAAAWFLLVSTIPAFSGANELFAFANYSAVVIALGLQIPLILMLLIAGKRRPPTRHLPDQAPDDSGGVSHKRFSTKRWMRLTHLSLALAAAAVIIGNWLGKDWAFIGSTSGAVYLAAWILAAWTTYMEVASVRGH